MQYRILQAKNKNKYKWGQLTIEDPGQYIIDKEEIFPLKCKLSLYILAEKNDLNKNTACHRDVK